MRRFGIIETTDVLGAIRSWLEAVELVPAAYARFTPLVVDGLLHFLGRLPPERLDAVVAAQLLLADDATPDDRLIALVRCCPTLHKLGQVVARQAGLPVDLRRRLQGLEMLAPAPGAYAIDALIARELATVPGLTVAGDALAEGSVAFVVPFTWQPGGAAARRGVFKALKPDAERLLLEDLAVWPELGDYLEERSAALGLELFDLRTLLDGVAHLLRNEIRLDGEQRRLESARRLYAGTPGVIIPELFPFCTPRLTAMERVDGTKVTDPAVPAATKRALARTIVDALLAKPFWSPPDAGWFFHADPHAGNLFATPDGKLTIFDWALTTRLSEAQLAAVVQTLLSAATLDESGMIDALAALGTIRRESATRDAVARAVALVRRGCFPGFGWLTTLLDELGRSGALSFPEQTALFRKSLLTLAGVVRDVSPNVSVDEVLVGSGGAQFIADAYARPFMPPASRAFGTHLSNADLVRFVNSLSWTPARFMLGAYRDLLVR